MCIKRFSNGELRGMSLIITGTYIIKANVSCHIIHGIFFCYISAAAANDHSQFRLVVDLLGNMRNNNWVIGTNYGIGIFCKQHRILWYWKVGFFGMGTII